jgi:hypothetical protein
VARVILFSAFVVVLAAGCRDDRLPTAPQSAVPTTISASLDAPASSVGASSICLVNQKALSDLDGQVQDNPENAEVKAQYDVQAAITADVCD